jgi:hypothetical protein
MRAYVERNNLIILDYEVNDDSVLHSNRDRVKFTESALEFMES